MGCIYLVTNRINGKQYVGQTVRTISYRRKRHEKGASPNSRMLICRALARYGIDNFDWDEVYSDVPDEDLNRLEMEAIKWYNSKSPNGYNLTDGGEGGAIFFGPHSKESRDKIGLAMRGRKLTEKHKIKIGLTSMGRKHPPRSEESRQKSSLAMMGFRHSQESKDKMSKTRKGRPSTMLGKHHSLKTKMLLSVLQKGKKKKPLTDEHKNKISKAVMGRKDSIETRMKKRESHLKRKCDTMVVSAL